MSREGAYRLASTCAKKRDPVFTPVAMQLPATQHLDLRREENRLRSIIISTVYSLTLFTLPTPSHRYPISSPRPDPTFLKPHEQSPASFRSLFLSGGFRSIPTNLKHTYTHSNGKPRLHHVLQRHPIRLSKHQSRRSRQRQCHQTVQPSSPPLLPPKSPKLTHPVFPACSPNS